MIKISQSLMKSYVDYLNEKECGLLFKAKFIDKDPRAYGEPSDAMKAGIYFEYLCTGALPKSGGVPECEYSYKGKANEKVSAQYERVIQSAENYKKIIAHYGIEVLEVGKNIELPDRSGVVDIYAQWNGRKVFIDLKYSGLIDDKWNEMGWELESLPMKDSLMIQGVHYKLLAKDSLGIDDIPFYYFVFSSQDPNNIRIIEQVVDESKMQSHVVAIGNIKEKINNNLMYGFNPRPSLGKCSNCPIGSSCQSKIDYPLIDKVYY